MIVRSSNARTEWSRGALRPFALPPRGAAAAPMTGVVPPAADGDSPPLAPARSPDQTPATEAPRPRIVGLRERRLRVAESQDGRAELLALLRETSERLKQDSATSRESARAVMADTRGLLDAIQAARAGVVTPPGA